MSPPWGAFCQITLTSCFCCCVLVLHCCKHMRLSCALNHLLTYLLTYLLYCTAAHFIGTEMNSGDGYRVWWRAPEKNHCYPLNGNFGCILTEFLTGRSLGTQILRFNRETKFTKTLQNLFKNSRSDQSGRSHNPPPLNTPLETKSIFYWRASSFRGYEFCQEICIKARKP